MNVWITLRNLRVRAGATFLTVLAVALAVATALVVPMITRSAQRGAADAAQVFDLLVTPKGSSTQAVLSSLFYLQAPLGNLKYATYERLARDPRTRRAVPIGLGDNYAGFPIVGTTSAFFDQRMKPTQPPYFRVARGRIFGAPNEAVLGAGVAARAGLGVGGSFRSEHGMFEVAGAEHEEHEGEYRVVGVLAPTGGPVDRAVLVGMESIWSSHGQFAPRSRGVTAVLYTATNLGDLYSVAQGLNASADAQAVFPGQVFAQVRGVLEQGEAAYAALSVLVLILAALTVWLSVYAASVERARGVSLLRALGARRGTVFSVVLLETGVTVLAGILLGVGLALLVGWGAGALLGGRLGFSLPSPSLDPSLLLRAAALFPLGLLAALPPAVRAARQSPLEFL
ncbi:ABC transporter permease [Deinococcus pimensis]|uniref:ABC transporter permease n=1 Tax=Deinococcus pimensis TaxID=309888 RepID=UPI0004839624|nr:ABC transporter permease [Deinococcus pimensis]